MECVPILSWNCWLAIKSCHFVLTCFTKQAWCVAMLLQHFHIDLIPEPYKTRDLVTVRVVWFGIRILCWECASPLFGGNAYGFKANYRWRSSDFVLFIFFDTLLSLFTCTFYFKMLPKLLLLVMITWDYLKSFGNLVITEINI